MVRGRLWLVHLLLIRYPSLFYLIRVTGTHSFISSKFVTQIGLESHKDPLELYMNLPMGKTVKFSVMYKNCPITLNQEELVGNLVQLDMSEFDVILGIDWLLRHRAKINCYKQRVSQKGEGEERCIFGGITSRGNVP